MKKLKKFLVLIIMVLFFVGFNNMSIETGEIENPLSEFLKGEWSYSIEGIGSTKYTYDSNLLGSFGLLTFFEDGTFFMIETGRIFPLSTNITKINGTYIEVSPQLLKIYPTDNIDLNVEMYFEMIDKYFINWIIKIYDENGYLSDLTETRSLEIKRLK